MNFFKMTIELMQKNGKNIRFSPLNYICFFLYFCLSNIIKDAEFKTLDNLRGHTTHVCIGVCLIHNMPVSSYNGCTSLCVYLSVSEAERCLLTQMVGQMLHSVHNNHLTFIY